MNEGIYCVTCESALAHLKINFAQGQSQQEPPTISGVPRKCVIKDENDYNLFANCFSEFNSDTGEIFSALSICYLSCNKAALGGVFCVVQISRDTLLSIYTGN